MLMRFPHKEHANLNAQKLLQADCVCLKSRFIILHKLRFSRQRTASKTGNNSDNRQSLWQLIKMCSFPPVAPRALLSTPYMCKNLHHGSGGGGRRRAKGFVSRCGGRRPPATSSRVAIFVANSTYFNHVNLLRKHLLCFSHTITKRSCEQTVVRGKGHGEELYRREGALAEASAKGQRISNAAARKFHFKSFHAAPCTTRATPVSDYPGQHIHLPTPLLRWVGCLPLACW